MAAVVEQAEQQNDYHFEIHFFNPNASNMDVVVSGWQTTDGYTGSVCL